MEAGRRAGARTVLYTAGQPLESIPYRDLADFVVESFKDFHPLVRWLNEST